MITIICFPLILRTNLSGYVYSDEVTTDIRAAIKCSLGYSPIFL